MFVDRSHGEKIRQLKIKLELLARSAANGEANEKTTFTRHKNSVITRSRASTWAKKKSVEKESKEKPAKTTKYQNTATTDRPPRPFDRPNDDQNFREF